MSAAEKSAQDLFREAAALVDLAVLKLDMTETRCTCCHAKRFRNRLQATIYSRHSDLPTRLRNSADELDADLLNVDNGVVAQRREGGQR